MMIDPKVALAGLFVGFVVGLTGMGGGALMTPILVLLFKIQPLAAVSSDIVASMIMKPVGGGVHWRRGTVNTELVRWLIVGSVPSAFLGVLLLKSSGQGAALQHHVKFALGLALLVVALGLIIRPLLSRGRAGDSVEPLVVKKLQTVLIGIAGGLVVGLTSVGSGSLMIILLLMLYPKLRLSELVGTDLVGSVPGVFIGAQLSSRAPDALIRPALILVLLGSSLKLLDSSNLVLASVIAAFAAAYLAVRANEQRQARPALKLR
jgi:uncharacterized membrane protein YfcA